MQTVRMLLLQQSSNQEVNNFLLKEPTHLFIAPSNERGQLQQFSDAPIQPLPLECLYTQTMAFDQHGLHVIAPACAFPKVEPPSDISADDRKKLHEVKRFIEQDFLHEHTIASLCRQASLNEFKLKKGFKALFGTRVIQYVRRLRMEHAHELLSKGGISIEEISIKLGYQYTNHFSTAYKRHFGYRPFAKARTSA